MRQDKRHFWYLGLVLLSASIIWIFFVNLNRGSEHLDDGHKGAENHRETEPLSRRVRASIDGKSRSSRIEVQQDVSIRDMPLEIEDWRIPDADQRIFMEFSDFLLEHEVSRIIDESHSYVETTLSDEGRNLMGVAKDVESLEVLHVTTALRPPDPVELVEIYGKLDDAIETSSVLPSEKVKIRLFFEDRFSLKEQRYKILDTNAVKLGGGNEVTRDTFVIVCDEFVADGEEGRKQISYKGAFEVEGTYANPEERVKARYGHLVDTEAGE